MDLKQNRLKGEVKRRVFGYLSAALGFVAGIAWNDAVKAFIEYVFPLSQNTLLAKFAYAILVTVLVVLATSYFLRSAKIENGD